MLATDTGTAYSSPHGAGMVSAGRRKMTKSELVKVIIATEEELYDGLDAHGFDFKSVAMKLESAKAELAARFGIAVGYGGIQYSIRD